MSDKKGFVILFLLLLFIPMLAIIFHYLEKGFKSNRQICEEKGGTYIEDYSIKNQNMCVYNK